MGQVSSPQNPNPPLHSEIIDGSLALDVLICRAAFGPGAAPDD